MGGVPGGIGGRSGFGVGAFGELGSRGGISGLGGCGTGSSGTGGFGVGSGMVRLSDMYALHDAARARAFPPKLIANFNRAESV
jgi:hypothetical protein